MRATLFLAVFALVGTRDDCGTWPDYDPCDGKAPCDACTLCPPDAPDCVETAVLKVCDADGQCVDSTGQCPPPPWDACQGKTCGESCRPCPPWETCETFAATACDPDGKCVTAGTFACEPPPPPPQDPCAGKACGDACTTCDPAAELCVAVMMYCDAAGKCGFELPVCTAAAR